MTEQGKNPQGPFEAQPSTVIAEQVKRAAGQTRQVEEQEPQEETVTKPVKVTYQLEPATIAAVRDIAERERFGGKQISKVAEALLAFAVAEYSEGLVEIEMVRADDGWRAQAVRVKN